MRGGVPLPDPASHPVTTTPDYDLAERARALASRIVSRRVRQRGGDDWTPLDKQEAEVLESAYIAGTLARYRESAR